MDKATVNNEEDDFEIIARNAASIKTKIVTLGFDAFIDSVVKVVRQKDDSGPNYFESTQKFGEYIVEKGQKSFSIELEELTTKLGGNMPITANAIAQIGANVSCIGPLGYPDIHPVFRSMKGCTLYSFANPGLTKVLEFRSGKIMMAEMVHLNNIPWEFIRDNVGVNQFQELFRTSDLIALLNWSELDNSTVLWQGLLRDVLPAVKRERKPTGLFDLSDCSKRENSAIQTAMKLLTDFGKYWDIILSLNLNEATIVSNALSAGSGNTITEMCDRIYEALNIQTVIVHTAKQSCARDANGTYEQKSFFIDDPLISSGAGDNFNAGFAAGKLLGLSTKSCLRIGNATSALYMRSAHSPTLEDIVAFLSDHKTES